MRILIVEDDEEKALDLQKFIGDRYVGETPVVAKSLQSGLREALQGWADLILLDMTMRNFDRSLTDDGGRPHHFAGREILRQLKRHGVRVPVIVVTHFDRFGEDADSLTVSELEKELSERFEDYLGTVHYRSNVDDWKAQLGIFMDTLGARTRT